MFRILSSQSPSKPIRAEKSRWHPSVIYVCVRFCTTWFQWHVFRCVNSPSIYTHTLLPVGIHLLELLQKRYVTPDILFLGFSPHRRNSYTLRLLEPPAIPGISRSMISPFYLYVSSPGPPHTGNFSLSDFHNSCVTHISRPFSIYDVNPRRFSLSVALTWFLLLIHDYLLCRNRRLIHPLCFYPIPPPHISFLSIITRFPIWEFPRYTEKYRVFCRPLQFL